MTQYELHQKTIATSVGETVDDFNEVMGDVEIPEEAIGINTVTSAVAPPIITVSWLEPVEN